MSNNSNNSNNNSNNSNNNSHNSNSNYKKCKELVEYIHKVASNRNPEAMKILQDHNYPKLELWPDGKQPSWSDVSHYVLSNDYKNLVESFGKQDFIPNLHLYISKHAESWPPYAEQQRPLYNAAADAMCSSANEIINSSLSNS